MKIGVVAASSRFSRETAAHMQAHMADRFPAGEVGLVFHEACFLKHGHFAGDDAARARSVVEFGNDPRLDAIWFARGGYGSCRIAEAVAAGLKPLALKKAWLGYSDAGSLLALLYRMGARHVAHGPMVTDINRHSTEAVDRGLDWLVRRDPAALEPGLDDRPAVAFNLTILNELMGTSLEPDLSGHVVLLEEVSEALYRVDRMMFHLTSQPSMRRVAGIRLGRVTDITPNEPDFGLTPEEIVRYWCRRSGIPYLGAADIGHDGANKVVPFGRSSPARG